MEDLDLDLIQKRVMHLKDWEIKVHDTRLSDAPYISVVVKIPVINIDTLNRLKEAFKDMPCMYAMVWIRAGVEVPLNLVDIAILG